MTALDPVALPAFRDNYVWGLARDGHALVVDPGDATVVEAWLARQGLQLETVLVTHHHPDHTGGLAALIRSHHPQVCGPREDIPGITRLLDGGEVLTLPPFGEARVLAVPGHTRAHIAYHFAESALLFCGDTLFSAGCGRLFEGTAAQLHASLQELARLPDATRVCCAHEYTLANLRFAAAVEPDNPARTGREEAVHDLRARDLPSLPVTLGEERRYNPFLRCDEPAVIAAASRQAGRPLGAGLETLTALRAWKDRF
jgi:hydroxyacylglutathione hydrolase